MTTHAPDQNYLHQYYNYFPNFWPVRDDTYQKLLDEIKPYLSQGTVNVFGEHKERRLTTYFSLNNATMHYSGRELTPKLPTTGGMVEQMLHLFSNTDQMVRIFQNCPDLLKVLPKFNAVFINWFRPPSKIDPSEKPDGLGWHSDDESSLASDVIFSLTICENNGSKLFSFRSRSDTSGFHWRCELKSGSALIMLPGCQKWSKHSVSDRKTSLNKGKITGGRINLTFRQINLNSI